MTDKITSKTDYGEGIAATGSLIGAAFASSCCVVPLLLITLGASGPWIGKLSALKAYQPVFVVLTAGFLGYGFWRVYWIADNACDDDSCATPAASRFVKSALWAATVLVALAISTDFWAPFFY